MNKKQLKEYIRQKELEIQQMHLHQDSSEICCQLYNTLILQKAVLKKELEDMNKIQLLEKIKKIFPKKEKLICDYWQK